MNKKDAKEGYGHFFHDQSVFLLIGSAIFFLLVFSGSFAPSWHGPAREQQQQHLLFWHSTNDGAGLSVFSAKALGTFLDRPHATAPVPLPGRTQTDHARAQQPPDHIFAVRGILSDDTGQSRVISPPASATPLLLLPMPVNQADENMLATLSGIGPVLARRIVSFRRHHGHFHSIRDLALVRGLTLRRLQTIEHLLSFQTE